MAVQWWGSFSFLSDEGKEKDIPLVSSLSEGDELPEMPRVRLIEENLEPNTSGRIDLLLETRRSVEVRNLSVTFSLDALNLRRVGVQGFQSWTESREFSREERIRGLNPLLLPVSRYYKLHNYGDYTFTSYSGKKGRFHGYTYMYFVLDPVDRDGEPSDRDKKAAADFDPERKNILLWGSLDESRGYTRFFWDWRAATLTVEKDCEGLVVEGEDNLLSVRVFSGQEKDVFDRYFAQLGGTTDSLYGGGRPLAGWTSWYKYYSRVSEGNIREHIEAFSSRKIPLDVVQIDDGWERALGDWLEAGPSFPSGMKAIADEISSAGFIPGLWLAPFLAEESSQLFREHSDWFLKDRWGDHIVVGNNPVNWRGRFYALDPLYPQVHEYLRRVFRKVLDEWGFSFVKLDFLYAAALIPREGKSRGRIMFEALRILREFVGDRMLLGCGSPLGSGFGLFDYCRVGADVAPVWEDKKLRALGYRERVSTVNSLRSTIGRHQLSGRAFGNDPDVFILRENAQQMSVQQRRSLFMINRIYGKLLFTSDNPAEYDERMWKLYRAQFPLLPADIIEADARGVLFRSGEQTYRAFHNVTGKKVKEELPERLYYEFEGGFSYGGCIELEAYQTRIFLVVDTKPYAVAGSSGSLFPGNEIVDFRFDEGEISCRLLSGGPETGKHLTAPGMRNNAPKGLNNTPGGQNNAPKGKDGDRSLCVQQSGSVFFKVPSFLEQCRINGTSYPCEEKIDMKLVVLPYEDMEER